MIRELNAGALKAPASLFDNSIDPNQLLTTAQLAQRLQIAEWTIRQWHHRGILRGIKVGPKAVRYKWDEILNWLATKGE